MYFLGFKHHSDGLLVITQCGQSHYQERTYLCIMFLVSLYSKWIFYICHSLSGGRLNMNGQPYAWNSTKSGRCMFNVCVFNAVQCMCTCGSSTHCVCVSMFVYLCVCVCVPVTALVGAKGPFKSKVNSFLPNLPYRCQLIQQLLHDGTCLKQFCERQPFSGCSMEWKKCVVATNLCRTNDV